MQQHTFMVTFVQLAAGETKALSFETRLSSCGHRRLRVHDFKGGFVLAVYDVMYNHQAGDVVLSTDTGLVNVHLPGVDNSARLNAMRCIYATYRRR